MVSLKHFINDNEGFHITDAPSVWEEFFFQSKQHLIYEPGVPEKCPYAIMTLMVGFKIIEYCSVQYNI